MHALNETIRGSLRLLMEVDGEIKGKNDGEDERFGRDEWVLGKRSGRKGHGHAWLIAIWNSHREPNNNLIFMYKKFR